MANQKIKAVTPEEWDVCNDWNKMIIDEFLQQQHLSDQTLKQYESGARIFARFIKETAMNKPFHELKPRDALKYQNYLLQIGLSPSAVKFKRSIVSTLCNYIELYYGDDFPLFRNIFNKAIASPAKQAVYEKKPLTKEEMETLLTTLKNQNELQMIAYIKLSYSTGARRAEIAQMKKEMVNYPKVEGKNYYKTGDIRTKGRGKAGKIRKLSYDDSAREAIVEWLEQRGEDECDSLFVKKTKLGKTTPLQPEAFNNWCATKFTDILGLRVTPHNFRRTRATHMVVEEGKDIKSVQSILGHESSETSEMYVIRKDDTSLDEAFD